MADPLVCPTCGRGYPAEARFCERCGMPLVLAGARVLHEPLDERHGRMRKIKPQYSDGELVRVAGGRNQTEAEFIQALLLEEGVPSLIRRSAGFDVPDFLAAGPRDIMVPASGVDAAREILLQADMAPTSGPRPVAPWKVLAGLFAGLAVIAVIVLLAG